MKYFKVADHLTFVKVLNPSRIGLYPVHLHKFPIIKKNCVKLYLSVSAKTHFLICVTFQTIYKIYIKGIANFTQHHDYFLSMFNEQIIIQTKRTEHYVPSNALSISVWVGRGLFLRSVYMDITIPGVQNPHWDPWDLAILS